MKSGPVSRVGSGPVAVTGLGAVSPLGWGWQALWAAVQEGRDGITEIERYSLHGFSMRMGGLVPGTNRPMAAGEVRSLCLEYAIGAAQEAAHEGGLWGSGVASDRIGLCVGTSLGDTEDPVHRLAESLGDHLGIGGPRITTSIACASSTNALGLGADLLNMGVVDLVLAGGADLLSDTVFAGFHALGVLSPGKCSPFGLPMGTTLGEGAGFLLLERPEDARARQKEPWAFLVGYGLSSDGYHETSPDPKGRGVGRAMASALLAAGLSPEGVGYVNAHGSGTEANDRAEWLAIQGVFGDGAASLPVSSTKGHLGHAQGAAGVLEGIVTLLSLREGVVPPTLRCQTPRAFGPDDPVPTTRPRPSRYDRSLCVSSAFGGANCVVAFSRSDSGHPTLDGEPPEQPPVTKAAQPAGPALSLGLRGKRRPASGLVVGVGAVGPFSSFQESVNAWLQGKDTPAGPVSAFPIEEWVPMADPREMDTLGRYLTGSAALALRDAGIKVRGPLRERTGLIAGVDSVSAEEARTFRTSIQERGLARCSATAFAKMVLNAAAGTCSKALSLKGPTSTLTTGHGSGLMAIIYACQLLASRWDVDLVVAAGADAQGLDGAPAQGRADGAACLVLGKKRDEAEGAPEPGVQLSGWGIAGPGAKERAIEAALGPGGPRLSNVDLVVEESSHRPIPLAFHAAFGSAWAVAAAAQAIRNGMAGTAVVSSGGGNSASCAIFLSTTEGHHGR